VISELRRQISDIGHLHSLPEATALLEVTSAKCPKLVGTNSVRGIGIAAAARALEPTTNAKLLFN
jgi:hypothetical protein